MSQFKKSTKHKNIIVISLGDPAGIGTEITLKALGSKLLNKKIKPLLVGCKKNNESNGVIFLGRKSKS